VIDTISRTTERNPFFRFIELVGIGGVIAFVLVIIFFHSPLLSRSLEPERC